MPNRQLKIAITIGGVVVVLGALLGAYSGLDWILATPPPKIHLDDVCQAIPVKETQTGLREWMNCFAFRREGLAACWLQGQPELQGAALARFFPEEFKAVDEGLQAVLLQPVRTPLGSWVLARYQALSQMKTSDYLPESLQKEILGFSRFIDNPFPQYGVFYQRLILNQSLYDRIHTYSDNQAMGSTAFGVAAEHTQDHSPLLAYNLDFTSGEILDQNKIVMCVQPENGHTFLSVTWPGQFGVMAGMNTAGIGIAVQPIHTPHLQKQGMPISVLAREVLTDASTLQQAVAILQSSPIRTSEVFLLGSGKENKFVVVEKAATLTAVREMEYGKIVAANYFLSPQWKGVVGPGHPDNSSKARLLRVQELLYLQNEPMSVGHAVAILRDQRGMYGERIGIGNAEAINSVRAVASLVFELEQKRIWVAQSPHQLGKYVAFTLEDFIKVPALAPVDPDPFLTSGKYNEYLVFRNGLEEAERYYQVKKYQDSLAWLQEVQFLNPLDYHAFYLAGKSLQALGRTDEAAYNFQQALKLHPAFLREKTEIQKHLESLPKELVDAP